MYLINFVRAKMEDRGKFTQSAALCPRKSIFSTEKDHLVLEFHTGVEVSVQIFMLRLDPVQ